MRERCHEPTAISYPRYGARGIAVCDRWRHDFAAFYADVGPRPSPDHQIERIDNDGPYSPENCRWATRLEQANNKRNNVRLTFNGETMTLPQWGRRIGVPAVALWLRLFRYGWTIEQALTHPHGEGPATQHLTVNGETRTVQEWCRLKGIKDTTLGERLKRGWTVERAITEPVRPHRPR